MADELDLLLASRFFYPTFGGAAERFRRYAPGLRQRGVCMRVLASERVKNAPARRRWVKSANVGDIPVQRVPATGRPILDDYHYFRLLAQYGREGGIPDIVHLLSLSLWALPSLPALRRLGSPVLYSYTLASELSANPFKRQLQSLYQQLPMRFADGIVVSSGAIRKHLTGMGVKRPIHVIPNGVDLTRFTPITSSGEKLALRARLSLPTSAPLVMYAGALSRRKGTDLLLRAWPIVTTALPDARLVLVGPSEADLQGSRWDKTGVSPELTNLLNDPAVRRSTILTGLVERVEDYYRAADCFVFPSRREGFGNVVAEAYACGIAVILTPFLGLPEELGRAGEHYDQVAHDPRQLADGIVRLLGDAHRRETLGHQGRAWAEEHLGLSVVLDRYATLYRNLVEQRQSFSHR